MRSQSTEKNSEKPLIGAAGGAGAVGWRARDRRRRRRGGRRAAGGRALHGARGRPRGRRRASRHAARGRPFDRAGPGARRGVVGTRRRRGLGGGGGHRLRRGVAGRHLGAARRGRRRRLAEAALQARREVAQQAVGDVLDHAAAAEAGQPAGDREVGHGVDVRDAVALAHAC